MKCPYCGNPIEETGVICMFCGMTLPGREPEPEPPETEIPEPRIPETEASETEIREPETLDTEAREPETQKPEIPETGIERPETRKPAARPSFVYESLSQSRPYQPSAQTAPTYGAPSQPVTYPSAQYTDPQSIQAAAPSRKATETDYDPPLSVGGFLGTILLSFVPVIGLIFLIVWASLSRVNTNRRNLSVVLLIFKLIGLFFLGGAALALFLLDIPGMYFPW